MEEEKTGNDNISNIFSNEEELDEEEIKPIPEISDAEEFYIDNIYKEYKKENKEIKENNQDNIIEAKDNLSSKKSFTEDDKEDFFPIDYLIPKEEINSINIDFNIKNKINKNDNDKNNNKPLNSYFFLTNLARKIKEKISRRYYSKQKGILNNSLNKINENENNSFGEEDEFEDLDEIEHFSGNEEKINNCRIAKNEKKNINNLLGIKSKEEYSDNDSFHSLSSSFNDSIKNQIGEIIDTNNKENSLMTQMLVETNKHYIKEQRQQSEKIQEWGLKVIFNIFINNKNIKLQNAFYLIKYSKISFKKNRGKILFKYYEKYKKKIIKKYFIRFRIKTIELIPRDERILDLIKGLIIDDKNIENAEKIEKLIKEKIVFFNKEKEEEEKNKKNKNNLNNNKLKNENEKNSENINNEKKVKKLINIDNNISIIESKNISFITSPPPPPPPSSFPGMVQFPPILENPLPPGVPPPPVFSLIPIYDPTKNTPKLPKGYIARKFQWKKLNFSNYPKSLWKQIEEEQEKAKNPLKIDYDSLQRIFTYEKITKKNQSQKEKEKLQKKEDKIYILDSKRLMNMSISLAKIKIDKDKLESLIEAYDIDNILDIETLKSILYFFPNDEEKKALLNYKDDITKLSYPDQFCRTLASIKNCQKILKILLFKKELSGKISNLLLQIRAMQDAVISINNSEQFKSILFILRQIGNYLNTGTSIGKAFGFSINSLSKLEDIKGINKEKTSLLEFFIIIIKKDNPGLINFYKDFKRLEESKNCFKEEIDKSILELKNMVNKILKEKENTNNEDYIVFINNVENYSTAKMDCLQLSQKFLNEEIDKTIIIFGENKMQFNINEFIKSISNFVEKYKTCSLEISKKEAKLLKKKLNEEKKKKELNIVSNDLQKICDKTIKSIAKKANLKNNINDIKKENNNKEAGKINKNDTIQTTKVNGIEKRAIILDDKENKKMDIKKNKEDTKENDKLINKKKKK